MSDEIRREKYFRRLNLPGPEPSWAHTAALSRAHDLRRFEIENYWKRSSYFWGFQLVAFAAVALTAKDGRFYPPIVMLVSVLGTLAAFTGILSARGSKFWQANWEGHVDLLEPAAEGRLHGTALAKGPIQFSVSRVNERFLEAICAGWLAAFLAAAAVLIWPSLLQLDSGWAATCQIVVPAAALIIGAARLVIGQRSDLKGRVFAMTTLDPL